MGTIVTWKGSSISRMYSPISPRRPRKRSRDSAQAAGVATHSCPKSWGNTWKQLFQNIEKNCGVSSSRLASGCRVGQLGSSCHRAWPAAWPSAGPMVAASSSAGVSAPNTRNHSGHHTASAAAPSTTVTPARKTAVFTD